MIVFVCLTFFFFKQKTAYEMRISDWSSDVCSSDLTLGHPAGDALLKQVAQRLLKIVGDREMVSRLGGDEFQIILPDIEDRGKLGDMATDIIASLSQPYSVAGSRCIIGASVDRKSTRLNSSHYCASRMTSSA